MSRYWSWCVKGGASIVGIRGGGTGRGASLAGEDILRCTLLLVPGVVVGVRPAVVPVGGVELDDDEFVLEAAADFDSQAVGQSVEEEEDDVDGGDDDGEEKY